MTSTLLRFDTLSSAMSGNLVRFGFRLQSREWDVLLVVGLSMAAFALGTIVTAHIFSKGPRFKAIAPCILLPGTLVLCDVLIEWAGDSFVWRGIISCLATFSMGGLNVVTARAPSVNFNVTFFTGTSKRIAEAIYFFMMKKLQPKDMLDAKMMVLLWIMYCLGASAGAQQYMGTGGTTSELVENATEDTMVCTSFFDTWPSCGAWSFLISALLEFLVVAWLQRVQYIDERAARIANKEIKPTSGLDTTMMTPEHLAQNQRKEMQERDALIKEALREKAAAIESQMEHDPEATPDHLASNERLEMQVRDLIIKQVSKHGLTALNLPEDDDQRTVSVETTSTGDANSHECDANAYE